MQDSSNLTLGNINYSEIINKVTKENKIIAGASSYITLWEQWYKGFYKPFHVYKVYNGDKYNKVERLSMKMAKQVCEDWASLLMNEKVQITTTENDKLDEVLMKLDFWNKANKGVEVGFALSMSALVLGIDDLETIEDTETGLVLRSSNSKGNLTLKCISAKSIVPITWKNGEIIECAFVQKDTDYTTMECHLIDKETKNYVIATIKVNNKNSEDRVVSEFYTESNKKWFAIIHPQLVNNIDVDANDYISVFANSIDTLKSIDSKYDSYYNEFLLGRKRTYVSSDLNSVDTKTGEIRETFDPNDTIIYHLPAGTSMNGESKPLIMNVSDALRVMEHSTGLQDELNFLSKQTGLGVDYYRFEKGRVMTATQVISEKSDTFRNLKKHEGVLEKALVDFIKTIMYASNNYTDIKFSDTETVKILFDDSIIEDKATEKENDRKDIEAHILSNVEYRMKWYGETEEEAREKLKLTGSPDSANRINAYLMAYAQNAITVEDFVELCYPEAKDKQALIDKLTELKKSGDVADAEALGLYNPNL